MIYQGRTIRVTLEDNNIARMLFDAGQQSVNKFDLATLDELKTAITHLADQKTILGLYVESAKTTFIVGADITQFHNLFNLDEAEIVAAVKDFNAIFASFEQLPFPTVAVVNGVAVGGGFEMMLACDYRVAGPNGRFGLPEVKLGINPGFGGTIRLPRLIGIDNAIEWIATGKEYRPDAALAVGAVDAVVAEQHLQTAALKILEQAIAGDLDYAARREEKQQPVKLNDIERLMVFITAKALVASQAGPHMPAPLTSVKSLEQSAALSQKDAIAIEAKFFARLAKTDVSRNLVALFLNEQDLSKRTAKITEKGINLSHIGVLGAGIMGGGIAYQAALKGKQVVMKDIAEKGLQQGIQEAAGLLSKRVDRGRMSNQAMAETLTRIQSTLHYDDFAESELAIEAVVENIHVKQSVLKEAEQKLKPGAFLASNTSTISISKMAEVLKNPENFCGMHFFNPVHKMPLVEVIRGDNTSEQTIATVVRLAKDMGKTPIVVNDCAGFYVNRVLFPYLAGFNLLLRDGADFLQVDKVMEKFGWPMGPAYLIDVVGLDTAHHAADVMAGAYPDRMQASEGSAINLLFKQKRFGQKNGKGFYQYSDDKKGKPVKTVDEESKAIIKPCVQSQQSFSDEEIIERLMIPMCFEVVRCLDEKIISNPIDADMGLLMGIGFPLFRGGAVRYMESIGLSDFVELSKKYHSLGKLYQAPKSLIEKAASGQSFFDKQEVEA